jgi:7-cyano-7-deazaguanine synthase in queuosine biosynthesis
MKAILYSGGLDSLLLWRRYPTALLVHFDYGQPYEAAERQAMSAQAAAFGLSPVLLSRLPAQAAEADGFVPFRNLLLAVAAFAVTSADEVMLGGVRGESSPDKSAAFLRAASRAASKAMGDRRKVSAPLRSRTKAAHLRSLVDEIGRRRAQRYIDLTTSCYRGTRPGCGECTACFRRWVAVTLAGLRDDFLSDPRRQELSTGEAWRHLRRTDAREWPGMLLNNLEAYVALQRIRVAPFR